MKKEPDPVVKRALFSWIFYKNVKLQILLVLIITVTVFARVLPLEMQKRVVNEAINLRDIDLLLLYCGIYLAAVLTASGLKFLTNMVQVVISQRATAYMRKSLYHYILTLPLPFFRNTQPGMVVSSLINELTTPGNFVGMAVAVPISNVLTLLAFAAYLFWLHPLLAVISLSIYPLVLVLVPQLQKRVNRANKRRVDTTRDLSSRISESITGIHEIQGNATYGTENSKYDRLVDKLEKTRVTWSLFRGSIKVTNNFFTSLGPFLVFILGGYLAINGQLELGAMVAFLSAQEKLYEPWKEMIEFYQVSQDAKVNYERTMSYFNVAPEHVIAPMDRPPHQLQGRLTVGNLTFRTDSGIKLLNDISFTLSHGEQMAVVGFSGSGKSTLGLCVGQLYRYSNGHIRLDDQEVSDLTKQDMAANVGIVSQSPFIFSGTIEENLLYSLTASQLPSPDNSEEYAQPTRDDLIQALNQTGLFVDTLRFGLNTILNPQEYPDLIQQIIRVRQGFQQEFGRALSQYVEFYNENKYLYHSSVTDNLIFGTPNDAAFDTRHLLDNDYFAEFLTEADLKRPLLALGADMARQTVDILRDLPADEVFFEQSPIAVDELPDYKMLVQRLGQLKLHQLSRADENSLLSLALRFRPGRHKMVALENSLMTLLLESRALFKDKIRQDHPQAITFYQPSEYIHSQTILNNIFFGRMKTDSTKVQDKINQSIIQLLIEEDLLETIIETGMQYDVGRMGEKLSGGQRQKLAIARVFLKKPSLLIMDEATSALDNKSQSRIQNLLETRWKGKATLIAIVHRLDTIKNYDRIAVMKAGKIIEMGPYQELIEKKGALHELVYGRR